MVATVSSLGAPLVPTIAADYGVSIGNAQWSLTIVLVVGAVATPVVGRFGDGPRSQLVLMTALGTLVLGNLLAAVHGPFGLFIFGRGLQGIGLALMPLIMGIARDQLPPERVRPALATLSVTAIAGVGFGYPLTGFIAEHFDFHIGYWIAAGLSVVAFILAGLVVAPSPHRISRRFDLVGAILLSLGLAGLLLSISFADEWGLASAKFLTLFPASLLVLGVWAWFENRQDVPLVNLRLMHHRLVFSTNLTAALAGVGMYMLTSMVIRYVQTPSTVSYGLGATVLTAGFILVPMSVMSLLSSRLVTYLSRWARPDQLLPLGVLVLALSMVTFAVARSELWQNFLVMGIAGIGVGSVFAVIPRLIVSVVAAEETSSALALTLVGRSIGFAIGSALSATILSAHTPAGTLYPSDSGYTIGAWIGAVVTVITALICWSLRPAHPGPE